MTSTDNCFDLKLDIMSRSLQSNSNAFLYLQILFVYLLKEDLILLQEFLVIDRAYRAVFVNTQGYKIPDVYER